MGGIGQCVLGTSPRCSRRSEFYKRVAATQLTINSLFSFVGHSSVALTVGCSSKLEPRSSIINYVRSVVAAAMRRAS